MSLGYLLLRYHRTGGIQRGPPERDTASERLGLSAARTDSYCAVPSEQPAPPASPRSPVYSHPDPTGTAVLQQHRLFTS